jgi:hypothetical protein
MHKKDYMMIAEIIVAIYANNKPSFDIDRELLDSIINIFTERLDMDNISFCPDIFRSYINKGIDEYNNLTAL